MKLFCLVLLLANCAFVSAAADLELQNIQGEFDGKLRLVLQIKNYGPEDAKNIGCSVHVYSEEGNVHTFDAALEGIAAGGTSQQEISFTPEVSPVAKAEVEIFDAVHADTTPASNLKTWLPGKRADLEISEAVIDTAQPVTGRTIPLRVKLRNKGPATVQKAKLSAVLLLFRERILLAENVAPTIAAGEEKEIKIVLQLARTKIQTEEGTINLQATILDTGTEDTNSNNNSFLLPVHLTLRMPDLAFKNIQISPAGVLSFSVVNIGAAPCEATTTVLYLNGALTRRYQTPALHAGGEKRHQYGGTKVLQGTQVTIVADFNADIEEASEENNRFQFTARN